MDELRVAKDDLKKLRGELLTTINLGQKWREKDQTKYNTEKQEVITKDIE